MRKIDAFKTTLFSWLKPFSWRLSLWVWALVLTAACNSKESGNDAQQPADVENPDVVALRLEVEDARAQACEVIVDTAEAPLTAVLWDGDVWGAVHEERPAFGFAFAHAKADQTGSLHNLGATLEIQGSSNAASLRSGRCWDDEGIELGGSPVVLR